MNSSHQGSPSPRSGGESAGKLINNQNDQVSDDISAHSADDAADVSGPTEWYSQSVGVGSWESEHPDLEIPQSSKYDPELLRSGDQRNVVDHYRYWTTAAIIADLDTRRHEFDVAIENFSHDHNIGTVVRTANAFLARNVHVIGKRRWNRRGAMVTDRYQHIQHHPNIASLAQYARESGLVLVAVDNTVGAVRLEQVQLPKNAILMFGHEGLGLTPEAISAADLHVSIAQFGSTRSINAGVAAGIVMHRWISEHADFADAW